MGMGGQAYILGPLVALVVTGVLALILRWAYGSSQSPPPPAPATAGDFGLLREVALVESEDGANALRALLSDAGIRSTNARVPGAGTRVLVFAADLDRARFLVGPR
jgi:hypothetical protein